MARLGTLQPELNAYYPDTPEEEKGCRRCNWSHESLPHVLNHCPFHLAYSVSDRHDRIVDRIEKAAYGKWEVIAKDEEYGSSQLRPDLIMVKGDTAIILDVTMPFDDSIARFARKRQEKINKYKPIAEDLKLRYKNVYNEVIKVGPLGSWDRKNDKIIYKICSKKYTKLMRNLIVLDTIRASRDIFWKHIKGVELYDYQSRFTRVKQIMDT